MPALDLVRYAIRHKPTGHYLPMRKRGRGGTFDEPIECSGKTGHMPRLMHSVHSARCTLRAWLEGKFIPRWEEDVGSFVDYVKPVPSRKLEEMEIIPIRISVLDQAYEWKPNPDFY